MKLIAIGGSAGGLDAMFKILAHLKNDIAVPIILILHRNNTKDNGLVEVLSAKTGLKVKEAEEKESLRPATVYIAPGDYHLLVEMDGSLSLDASEKINYSRPSIDASFDTAAEAFGEHLLCIVLSGASADGAAGVANVIQNGGTVIVQHPDDALVGYMPLQSLANNGVDKKLTAVEIAEHINQL